MSIKCNVKSKKIVQTLFFCGTFLFLFCSYSFSFGQIKSDKNTPEITEITLQYVDPGNSGNIYVDEKGKSHMIYKNREVAVEEVFIHSQPTLKDDPNPTEVPTVIYVYRDNSTSYETENYSTDLVNDHAKKLDNKVVEGATEIIKINRKTNKIVK